MAEDSIKILICDDEEPVRKALAEYCIRLCRSLDVICSVREYSDGDELLDGFERDADFLLLDIEMPLLDGMQAARQIRAFNESICIVFITSFERYAVPGYEVGAYRYLLKPVEYRRFSDELSSAFLSVIKSRSATICLKTKGGFVRLTASEIALFETGRNHRVTVSTKDGPIVVFESLTAIEQRINQGAFFRCHESYIVNLAYISYIGSNEIRLSNGAIVPISKHRKKRFKETFDRFACQEAFGSRSV